MKETFYYHTDDRSPEASQRAAEAAHWAAVRRLSGKIEHNKSYVVCISDIAPEPVSLSPYETTKRNGLEVNISETYSSDNPPVVHGMLYFREYAGGELHIPFLSIRLKYRYVGRDDLGRYKYEFSGEA